MTNKTPLGLDVFDAVYGGVYRGRPVLVSGISKTGKSLSAFHFINRGLRMQERCLMLSVTPPQDIVVRAEALGMPFGDAVDHDRLVLLEYRNYVPGRDSEMSITLPPEGFEQMANIIQDQVIDRLVLDTVLPWVSIPTEERLAEHVFSFVRTFERLGVTSLFTIPRAASLKAARLFKLIDDLIPVSITLLGPDETPPSTMIVNKYLGMDDKIGAEFPYRIKAGAGLVFGTENPEPARPSRMAPTEPSVAADSDGGVRFAERVLGEG
jgi:archaellum biogenesis ATPase FlaH